MNDLHDQLSAQYFRWELRCRGWITFDEPVALEPPFRPFEGYSLPAPPVRDDVRRASWFERLAGRLRQSVSAPPLAENDKEDEDEPAVDTWNRTEAVEFQLTLPKSGRCPQERVESLLLMLSSCREPVAFEIMASRSEIVCQWVASPVDAPLISSQLAIHCPEVAIHQTTGQLESAWEMSSRTFAVAELGLARDFMLSLARPKHDFYLGLLAAMSTLEDGELALFQTLFEPARQPWAESTLRAVLRPDGAPLFKNRPELAAEAPLKFRQPLFAVVPRMAACAATEERTWNILAPLVASINSLAKAGGNHLVPLAVRGYAPQDQEQDILARQSRRFGAVLNLDELTALVHLPEAGAQAPKLRTETGKTRAAPTIAEQGELILGWNEHAGVRRAVCLSDEQRVRHLHIIGGTGTGKTNLLLNLIRQDIESDRGLAVLDPHGDLVDRIVESIPDHRLDDVVLLDASDEEYSIGFNVLSAQADFEKNLLASDLVSIFERLSTSWGDQMAVVLRNAILAFLERPEGGNLADVQRFLLEPGFRQRVLQTVADPDVVYYWKKGFPQLSGSKSIGPVLTRLQTFLSPKPIRYMVSQRENRLDLRDIMDSGKILLAKLPQGLVGAENSYLLGSLIVSKLQQAAMSRQRMPEHQRRLFTLHIDEFQNFITPSMAEILSGARKYRLAMVLAHQELAQLGRNDAVSSAVRSNAGTRVVFRVSDADARELARGFSHFEPEALQSLSTGQALVRIDRSDNDFNLSVPQSIPVDPATAGARRLSVTSRSRLQYARLRTDIVAEELARRAAEDEGLPEKPAERRSKASLIPTDPSAVPSPPSRENSEVSAPAPPSANEPGPAVVPLSTTPPQPPLYEPTSVREDHQALGRGGEIHQTVQSDLKQIAEDLGFRASIEHQLPHSVDTVDLYLERGPTVIACEVSVTNTLDYEVKNVMKSLKAGLPMVAVVALDPSKLSRLEAAVRNRLSSDQTAKVRFFLREDFVAFLRSLPQEDSVSEQGTRKKKGWKVRTTLAEIGDDEARQRELDIAATLAESLRARDRRKKH